MAKNNTPLASRAETIRPAHNSMWCYTVWYDAHDMIWASCQIRKIVGVHAPRMPGLFSLPPRVSYPDMHHSWCMTYVPLCMQGSLTSSFLWSRRKNAPGIPSACSTHSFTYLVRGPCSVIYLPFLAEKQRPVIPACDQKHHTLLTTTAWAVMVRSS